MWADFFPFSGEAHTVKKTYNLSKYSVCPKVFFTGVPCIMVNYFFENPFYCILKWLSTKQSLWQQHNAYHNIGSTSWFNVNTKSNRQLLRSRRQEEMSTGVTIPNEVPHVTWRKKRITKYPIKESRDCPYSSIWGTKGILDTTLSPNQVKAPKKEPNLHTSELKSPSYKRVELHFAKFTIERNSTLSIKSLIRLPFQCYSLLA